MGLFDLEKVFDFRKEKAVKMGGEMEVYLIDVASDSYR